MLMLMLCIRVHFLFFSTVRVFWFYIMCDEGALRMHVCCVLLRMCADGVGGGGSCDDDDGYDCEILNTYNTHADRLIRFAGLTSKRETQRAAW